MKPSRVKDFDFLREHSLERFSRSGRPPTAEDQQTAIMGRGLEKGFSVLRKQVDQIGRSRWCLTRLWTVVVTLTSLFLLASVTSMGTSMQGSKIFYPRKLVLSYPRDHESSAQVLWELRAEQMFQLSFNKFRQKSGSGAASKTHPRSLTSHGGGTLTEPSSTGVQISGLASGESFPFIEDLVVLPEDLDLFIVRHGSSLHQERISACSYGDELELKSVPRMVDLLPGHRLGVSCTRPSSLRTQKTLKVEKVSLELDSGAEFLLPRTEGILSPARWDEALVYAVQSTEVDVVLYVKNLFDASKRKITEYTELENFRCKFGDAVETPVTAGAQEVFRCESPSVNHPTTFATSVKVHLLYKGKTIPSVAYYEPTLPAVGENHGNLKVGANNLSIIAGNQTTPKKYLICSCTMIWNVAKFLREWVLFNSDLGVEKFFLYDNNSEDDIRRAVSELSDYNVTRTYWPWVKTQEAGFSNCAIEAQRECTWILFTDVDEYLFPKRWLNLTSETESAGSRARTITNRKSPASAVASPLASLIADTVKRAKYPTVGKSTTAASVNASAPPSLRVGQISFFCRNFGPSGRISSPPKGVTQGYTCRDKGELRHKSIVYFPALTSSLQNVIHHFNLKPTHQTVYLDARQAVVNHYKYQAWSEFEKKFAKRASTYVVDWKETKNLNSRDRPEGVGPEAKKPPDWETSHCAINDTALRDYTRRRFGIVGLADSVKMAWELQHEASPTRLGLSI